jgi:flagellar hook-length control protein FliK
LIRGKGLVERVGLKRGLPPEAAPAATAAAHAAASAAAAAPTVAVAEAAASAPQDLAATPTERHPAGHIAVTTPSAPAAAGSDSVVLSGPPTAWRQTLQEALGERLHLQVGKNAEQAVIRLDPPNLGRIEIAIRHSAGSLEVSISASHGEVLRQLQTVSDSLRSDLAQRQFTDVAVTVSPTRASASAGASSTPFGNGEQSGRGGQKNSQQDQQTPGQALAEAHNAASSFSLNARA